MSNKGFKLTLNLEQDSGLREYVKQLIREEVISVCRSGEIRQMVQDALYKAMPNITAEEIRNRINADVREIVNETTGSGYSTKKVIMFLAEQEATKLVREMTKDIKQVIVDAVKEKL